MIIEELQMFIEAANKHNITQAAPLFKTSRDRIRNHIIHLEKEVGVPLFIKTPNGSYLNKDGEIMYQAFQRMIMEYQNAVSYIKERHSANNSKFRIAVNYKLYNSYCHSEINSSDKLNNHFFDYVFLSSNNIYNTIINEEVDFAILYNSTILKHKKSLAFLPLFTDRLCLMVSQKIALSRLNELSINDVIGQVIYYDEQLVSQTMLHCLNILKKRNTIISISGNDYNHQYNTIYEEGACYLWYYKNALKKYQSRLVPIALDDLYETYGIVFKESQEKREVANKIIENFKEYWK